MINGITVTLYERKEVAPDKFGKMQYMEVPTPVEDVLVGQPTSDDIPSELDLEGKKAIYMLAIPKGDVHNWDDAIVEFFGRKWKVCTIPIEGIEANIPLRWNKKVMVEAYE